MKRAWSYFARRMQGRLLASIEHTLLYDIRVNDVDILMPVPLPYLADDGDDIRRLFDVELYGFSGGYAPFLGSMSRAFVHVLFAER